MRVLVTYASRYGATEGIAQRIAEVLRARGLEVEIARCSDVDSVTGFDAYIVGSAVYEFNWLKDAREFVKRHTDELATHPTWLFSSGPVGTDTVDKQGRDVLTGAEPKQFGDYAELLHPRGTQVFRGAFDHDKVRGADRIFAWIPAIREILPEGDYREWQVIEAWAQSVADSLQPSAARN